MSAELDGSGVFACIRCKPRFAVWDAAMFALKNIKSIKYNNSI